MALALIGIGLADEKDISVKGLEQVKQSDVIYLEYYTSLLSVPVSALETFYGKKIIVADRAMMEQGADAIVEEAKTKTVSVLIVGDVFGATTHMDIFLRAKQENVPVTIIHNASILNAVGVVGLELYKYGKTTSIPFPEPNHQPESFYDVLVANKEQGMHTLLLLDLRPTEEKYMTVGDALTILLNIAKKREESVFTETTKVVGCARIGGDQKIMYGTVAQILEQDFGAPLHCLIVPGKLHFLEEDALAQWAL